MQMALYEELQLELKVPSNQSLQAFIFGPWTAQA